MSLLRTLALPALVIGTLGLIGCADSDGDGLSNSKEKKFGTDQDVADSDGDGIDDGAEVDQGLDPTKEDTDGDGYTDGDEIHAGSDPADAASKIYEGGWPYNRNKDDLNGPGFGRGNNVGDMFPRFTAKDQFRDDVDLYDLAGHGKPILIDVSAQWCGPCNEMADWLEGGPSSYSSFNNVRRAVNNGEVIFVTFLAEDNNFDDARAATVREWYEQYPNENVLVLVDHDKALTDWMDLQFFPSTMWLNDDMTIEVYDPAASSSGLSSLSAQL